MFLNYSMCVSEIPKPASWGL